MQRDTLARRVLDELVEDALTHIQGHVVIREPGSRIESGLIYVGRLVTVLSEHYNAPQALFSGVGEDTIVLFTPPPKPWKRPRR